MVRPRLCKAIVVAALLPFVLAAPPLPERLWSDLGDFASESADHVSPLVSTGEQQGFHWADQVGQPGAHGYHHFDPDHFDGGLPPLTSSPHAGWSGQHYGNLEHFGQGHGGNLPAEMYSRPTTHVDAAAGFQPFAHHSHDHEPLRWSPEPSYFDSNVDPSPPSPGPFGALESPLRSPSPAPAPAAHRPSPYGRTTKRPAGSLDGEASGSRVSDAVAAARATELLDPSLKQHLDIFVKSRHADDAFSAEAASQQSLFPARPHKSRVIRKAPATGKQTQIVVAAIKERLRAVLGDNQELEDGLREMTTRRVDWDAMKMKIFGQSHEKVLLQPASEAWSVLRSRRTFFWDAGAYRIRTVGPHTIAEDPDVMSYHVVAFPKVADGGRGSSLPVIYFDEILGPRSVLAQQQADWRWNERARRARREARPVASGDA
ncbi:uncharacterized protein PFL1_02635 [Pseudozyma flocculosa PF-1]|uniref:Uncharacterized protein n=2 Tax=Pseudozyma flocculosa TaxID=84751 RepID=A0A5C3EYH1_9BASI|nr:uncharacterized protein PFL1_02635 [Pseudozyma flocculosa PF-1]EPQ29963.1 hypothetical protein PFL1_02635 [Pseudozyma flocculosa PF-1]SPO37278.1 uncharacterized protein PSFLO_02750 [Pseudozyma flocculosa]